MKSIVNLKPNPQLKYCYLIFLIITILTINSLPLSAQTVGSLHPTGYNMEKQAGDKTKWMTKELNLENREAKSVYEINLKYLKKSDSLRMNSALTTIKKDLHLQITQKKNEELQSILSAEKYNKYISIVSKAKRYYP